MFAYMTNNSKKKIFRGIIIALISATLIGSAAVEASASHAYWEETGAVHGGSSGTF